MQDKDQDDIRQALEGLFDALLTLRAEVDQRDRGMRSNFDKKMAAVQNQLTQTERKLEAIADGAGTKIERHAREAVLPVAAEYGRSIESFSGKLGRIEKTVWIWGGAAAAILALTLAGLWWTLTGYKRDLDAAKEQYTRFEHANAILQAYTASDAIICGDLICVNTDPNGKRQGDKRQYRQALPREQK